jgi:tetratricopeptide (TPR) repeat protein
MNQPRRTWWVGTATGLLALVVAGSGCGEKPPAAAARAVEADLAQAEAHLKAGRWVEVRVALARAEGRLDAGGPKALRERLARLRKDVEVVARLEEVRLAPADGKGKAAALYAEAFRAYGLDIPKMKAEEAGRSLRASAVRRELLAALDAWAMAKPDLRALGAAADAADDDPWRKRLRSAAREKDRKALAALARGAEAAGQPSPVLVLLARALSQVGLRDEAVKVLRRGQERHPGDFWLNYELGLLLARPGGKRDEATGYFRAALALRPNSPVLHLNLGTALLGQGRVDEAIACFRRAIQLDPAFTAAHANLGHALRLKGDLPGAIACFRKALALDPKLAGTHSDLGVALYQQGKLDEAIACFRKAIALDPRFPAAHLNLGQALAARGQLDEAVACFRKAIELDPKLASAHSNLGVVLSRQGKLDEAIACFRKAIALDPRSAGAHFNLGTALRLKGDLDGAIACFREALRLQPRLAAAKKALDAALKEKAAKAPKR